MLFVRIPQAHSGPRKLSICRVVTGSSLLSPLLQRARAFDFCAICGAAVPEHRGSATAITRKGTRICILRTHDVDSLSPAPRRHRYRFGDRCGCNSRCIAAWARPDLSTVRCMRLSCSAAVPLRSLDGNPPASPDGSRVHPSPSTVRRSHSLPPPARDMHLHCYRPNRLGFLPQAGLPLLMLTARSSQNLLDLIAVNQKPASASYLAACSTPARLSEGPCCLHRLVLPESSAARQ
jgi:hypothetical protein